MKTKICPKCKKEKDISEFFKNRRNKDGLSYLCKKCKSEYGKKWRRKNPIRTWCLHTINSHKGRGYKVNITINELHEIAKKTKICPVCNVELKWKSGKRLSSSPALDRKDNQKTLTLENIWIICDRCNITKHNRAFDEFIEYCEMVYKKFKKDI